MATNQYINNYSANNEQNLLEDLVVESIKFYGHDLHYLPRTNINVDDILNEPQTYKFGSVYDVEMYLKSTESFEGDGTFLSNFGVEIRDQIILTVSNRSFDEFVGTPASLSVPREGDIIYVPVIGTAYQIMYVNKSSVFYQLGRLTTWDLTCELFEYSNEVFETGNTEIDNKYNAYSTDGETDIEDIDEEADNEILETEGSDIIDFSERNPFSEEEF